jgi:very-short-patch-repair endonuclease
MPGKAHRAPNRRDAARSMRQDPTDAERKLWQLLRGKQLADRRFRRQQPIGPYIADFYCSVARLVIELDGFQHADDVYKRHDARRTQWLQSRGYEVLRFWNSDVLRTPDMVIETIWLAVDRRKPWTEPLPENLAR